jgi:membrane protease YdiL (CAAX protease family)
VSYSVYVVASVALYYVLPLRTAAAISSVLLPSTAYYLIWKTAGRPWRYVRLGGLKASLVLYSILAAIALIPVAASLMAVVVSAFKIPEEWIEAMYELVKADSLHELLIVWLVTAPLAAFGEEFVFRGVLQNSLSTRFRPWLAVLVASAVFGVLHVWRFPAAFMLGAFLGALYAITGSLTASIVAHLTVNTAVVLVSFLLDRAGPQAVPTWLSENAPAPAAVLVVCIAAFAFLMHLIRRASTRAGAEDLPHSPKNRGDCAA